MSIVFITGGGGFIGSHLVDSQLAHGHQVRTVDLHLDRINHQIDHPNLTAIEGSITDDALVEKMVDGADIVYHLASAHLDVSLSDTIYHQVNVDATMNLIKRAHSAGVQKFVHCSSVGVIGDVDNPPADENTACSPTNIYEQTKLKGEQAAIAYQAETGFPIIVVRPAWVYGLRCPRTAKLLRTIQKGRFPIFGKGQNLRHPIYIDDAVHGMERAAASGPDSNGQIYILAGRRPVQIAELLNTIAAAVGASSPKIKLPQWSGILLGNILQAAFTPLGKSPPFSRRSMDFYMKNNAYIVDKAINDIDFQPRYNLEQGMIQTVAQLRAAGEL